MAPAPHTPHLGELTQADRTPGAAWWRGALIGSAALTLSISLLIAMWLFARPLALLFGAIAIAEGLDPLVSRLQRYMPRTLAVVLVYLLFVLAVSGILWLVVPRLVTQAQEFTEELPRYLERGRNLIDEWDPGGGDRIIESIQGGLGQFSNVLLGIPMTIVSSVVEVVLVLFMSVYWLISAPKLGKFVRSLFPTRTLPQLETVMQNLHHTVGGYVRGEVINMVVVAILGYIGLLIIGVQYAVVLAIIAGLGELVPNIGPVVAAVPAIVVGFLDSPTQGLIVAGFYIVLQQIESNILVPNIMNQQADVPPLLAIVAVIAGGTIGGILGVLVSIPLAGAIKVIVVDVVAPAIRRWSKRSEGFSSARSDDQAHEESSA